MRRERLETPMPDHPLHPDIELMSPAWYQGEPLEHYRWMRENAPVYWDPSWEIWGVNLHEDVMLVSKMPEIFCSAKGSRPDSNVASMINMDDPGHKRHRNLVNRGFTPKRLLEQEAKAREVCIELIERVAPRGECEFVRDVAAPLPMVMIGDMLGVAPEDRDKLLQWSDDFLRNPGSSDPADQKAVYEASQGWADYIAHVIEERRSNPGDDLISILVHAKVDGVGLTDEEINNEALLILIGGDETTRHVITQGTEALIRNPDQRQKLIDHPSKITVAVEEMLRWVSPIKNMNRTATQDTELRGQKIREGDRLILLYASANRDPAAFEDPDFFRVERTPNNHVAFGGYGTHHCLGASLARMELRVMFEELLKRLPDLELASDDLPLRKSDFIVGIEEMPVRFTPRG
jgi:cytochrome P450 family 142 subfamily A polypeptide 1